MLEAAAIPFFSKKRNNPGKGKKKKKKGKGGKKKKGKEIAAASASAAYACLPARRFMLFDALASGDSAATLRDAIRQTSTRTAGT